MQLGRYRIVRELGEGGMGRVYLGEAAGPSGFSRKVVIKLVAHPESPELEKALVDEARIAAQLVHKNIVPVLDLDEQGGEQLVILEHVDGLDLRQLLQLRGKLDWRLAAFIAAEVAAALDYAHRKQDAAGRPMGLIHRDVSPGNILLSWEGEVKLGDFGAAQVAKMEDQEIRGTLAYMAPEQARGEDLDGRADQFALGLVMYEMLAARIAFADATLASARSRTAPPVESELGPIIARATAPRRENRYPGAAELREAILGLPSGLKDPGRALATALKPLRSGSMGTEALRRAALGAGRPLTQVAQRSSGGRTKWALVAAAAVASLAAIVVALSKGDPPAAVVENAVVVSPAPVAPEGSLSVNAVPWARIYVDGRAQGHTPRRGIALPAGSHVVKLVTEGGDQRSRTVHIAPDKESRLSVDFTAP